MAVERATNGTTWHTFFVQKERQAFAQHGHITELMKIVENNLKNLGRQVHITPDEISVEIQTRRSKSFKITFSFQRDESIQENVSQTTR
jgi:YbbR domain-containing protein